MLGSILMVSSLRFRKISFDAQFPYMPNTPSHYYVLLQHYVCFVIHSNNQNLTEEYNIVTTYRQY
jgi:hypothetical protein